MEKASGHEMEFVLIKGGILNRIFAATGLADPTFPKIITRTLALVIITWLPMLILSIIEKTAWNPALKIPFLLDIATNVRFVVCLPLLIIVEKTINDRMSETARYFGQAGLLPPERAGEYRSAIKKTDDLCRSFIPEIVIIIIVILSVVSSKSIQLNIDPSIASWQREGTSRTIACWWYNAVSHPIYRFFMFRWLWWLIVWTIFLWRMSRLDLQLTPTHPDNAGGLGFVGVSQSRWGALCFIISLQVSSFISGKVFLEGASLQEYQWLMVGFVVLLSALFFAPLLLFTPQLIKTKRKGLFEYGALAEKYTSSFDNKWITKKGEGAESLLGTPDIQSLADLANSFSVIEETRAVIFNKQDVIYLAILSAIPFLPLLFFVYGIDVLLKNVVQLIL
jgi:hypothetical protein